MGGYIFKKLVLFLIISNSFSGDKGFYYNHDKVGIIIEKTQDNFCVSYNNQNKKEGYAISAITINNKSGSNILLRGKNKILYIEKTFFILKNKEVISRNICVIGKENLVKYSIRNGTKKTFYIPYYTKLIGYDNKVIQGDMFLEQNMNFEYISQNLRSKLVVSKKYNISNKYENDTLKTFEVK